MTIPTLAAAAIMVATLSTSEKATTQPRTVEFVDVNRYMGRWYEIARYTKWFEKNMTACEAFYTLNPKGYVEVRNSGMRDGVRKVSVGKAKIVDTRSNAKLKVSFFGPFYAPYWVIDLASDYSWAVVSDPRRKTLWILSRTPTMPDELYNSICGRLAAEGYDLQKLEKIA